MKPLIIAVSAMLLAGSPAVALEYRFGGHVERGTARWEALAGTAWSVEFVLDPVRVADSNAEGPVCAIGRFSECYSHGSVIARTTLTIDGRTTELSGANVVWIERDLGTTRLDLEFQNATVASPAIFDSTRIAFGVGVQDPSGAVITSLEIPSQLEIERLDLTLAEAAVIVFDDAVAGRTSLGGLLLSVDRFEIVPEPGTGLLLGGGLAAMASTGRRRLRGV